MKWLIFICILYMGISIQGYAAKHVHKRGVMDNLNDRVKMAGQMLGINTAADVANLVAKAFSTATSSNGIRNTKPDILTTIIQQALKPNTRKPAIANTEESTKADSEENQSQQQAEINEESGSSFKQYNTKSKPSEANDNFGLNLNTASIVTSMLRMVGFDATKLGALAINALIMIAAAIGNTILGNSVATPNANNFSPTAAENEEYEPKARESTSDHQPRKLKDGSPLDWFLQSSSPKIKRLLSDIMDSELADKITEMIEQREQRDGQGGCLKMLMCKSAPIIWGMQKSLKNRIDGSEETKEETIETKESFEVKKPFGVENFYHHLPSLAEFREHGAKCEKLYSNYCNVTKHEYPKNRK